MKSQKIHCFYITCPRRRIWALRYTYFDFKRVRLVEIGMVVQMENLAFFFHNGSPHGDRTWPLIISKIWITCSLLNQKILCANFQYEIFIINAEFTLRTYFSMNYIVKNNSIEILLTLECRLWTTWFNCSNFFLIHLPSVKSFQCTINVLFIGKFNRLWQEKLLNAFFHDVSWNSKWFNQ